MRTSKRKEHMRRALTHGGPRILAVAGTLCCLSGAMAFLWTHLNVVHVTDASNETSHLVMACTEDPQLLAQAAGLELNQHDDALFAESGGSLALLKVVRAYPVALYADGQEYVAQVSVGTVKDAVQHAGITLSEEDFTEPALDSRLYEGMPDIVVHRVTYEDTVTTEPIPFEEEFVEEVEDPEGQYIHDILFQEGIDGSKEVTTRARYVDGEYAGSEVIQETVITPAQNAVYKRIQTNVVSPLSAPDGITVEDNVPSSFSEVYTMKATGYYSASGKGASGLGLYYGTFAVDPTLIPYGTKVYIVSTDGKFVYGWAIATDTGAFVRHNRMQVDLFYETYEESAENGVKEVYVYVP